MESSRPVADPATRFLLGANVLIFVLKLLEGPRWYAIERIFALSSQGLAHGEFWQLFTYQFLHANEFHLLVNMLGLWFIGRELEPIVGTRRFVELYLIGGVVGGIAQIWFAGGPLVGASASVCAILLGFTTLYPRLPTTALIFFVLPMQMRAATLGYGMVAISLGLWWSGWMPQVGHLAHLGGFASGWVFGRIYRKSYGEGTEADPFLPEEEDGAGQPATTYEEVVTKVSQFGLGSLSRAEKRILENAPRRGRWS